MGAKVLLAHGDTHQLEVAVQALTADGFEVVATPDGGDAFARFFEENPDVVIASVVLPVLDGRGFATMIKSQTPDVPVVLLTEQVPTEPDESGILYLPEPLDVDLLRELVPSLGKREHAETEADVERQVSEENRELYETLLSFQRQGNILSLLDAAGLERLAAIATIQDRSAAELVIREGDPCDGFYLVVIGAVRVTLAERGDEEVARLGPGEFFGEMALLSDQPRSASVWTCDPSKLVFFEREAVLELLHDYPEMRELLGGVALQRAEENLWQALSGDDDVQRNLSVLLDGLEEEDGVASVEISAGDTAAPPTPTALDSTGVPSGTGGPLPAPVPPGELVPAEAPEPQDDVDVTSVSASRGRGFSWSIKDALYSLRLYSLRHQFGAGLALGAVVGIVAMVAALAVVTGDEPEGVVPVVPKDGHSVESNVDTDSDSDVDADSDSDSDTDSDTDSDSNSDADIPTSLTPADPALPSRPGLAKLGRKTLRKALMAAYDDERHEDALACGVEMERRFELDWESEFKTADAARELGYDNRALTHYRAFAEKYATNVYADDALFFSAKILAKHAEFAAARELFERVAADPESNLQRKAEKRAAELPE